MAKARIELPQIVLLLATLLLTLVTTYLLRDARLPIGWNYLSLFFISATASLLGPGIYRWTIAAWGGVLLLLVAGALRGSGYLNVPPALLAAQLLPAALTGAMLGEWLRYQANRLRGIPFSPEPSLHVLIAAAALLVVLPLLTFLYSATLLLTNPHLDDLLMFAPHNTPFILPSLITALLIGVRLRSKEVAAPRSDKQAALILMIVAVVLMVVALFAKVVFGIVEVA